MMKKLIKALSILIFILGGYLLSQHIFSIFVGGEGLFIWLTMVCAFIYFGRHNKDGIYRLFKDIHQSNLDDIKQQQLEDPVEEVVVKEQILNSLAAVKIFWLTLLLAICCVSFLIA